MTDVEVISPPAAADVETDGKRHYRHNFLSLLGDYILFGVAFSLMNVRSLPPEFVASLGGGPVLVGMAGLLYNVTWLMPQLLAAPYVNRAERKKGFLIIPGIPGRPILILVGLLMIAVGPSNPGLLIVILLGGYVFLAVTDGVTVMPWMDVLGSSLSSELRGQLFAWGQALTGVAVAVIAVPVVREILGPQGPAFPNNYAVLMIIIGVLLTVALVSLNRVREGHSPPPQDSPGMREYFPFLGRLIREDAGFRNYLVARFVYDLVRISDPFYIVFMTQVLLVESADALSDQILLSTLTSIVAAVILGRMNARRGPRSVVRLSAAVALLHPLLALSALVIGPTGIHLAWIALSLTGTAFVPGFLNWIVEYAPKGYRPIYSGVSNTFSAFALLAPLLGGVIVATISYQAVFVVAALLAALSAFLA